MATTSQPTVMYKLDHDWQMVSVFWEGKEAACVWFDQCIDREQHYYTRLLRHYPDITQEDWNAMGMRIDLYGSPDCPPLNLREVVKAILVARDEVIDTCNWDE
jgi:hypothetical protein